MTTKFRATKALPEPVPLPWTAQFLRESLSGDVGENRHVCGGLVDRRWTGNENGNPAVSPRKACGCANLPNFGGTVPVGASLVHSCAILSSARAFLCRHKALLLRVDQQSSNSSQNSRDRPCLRTGPVLVSKPALARCSPPASLHVPSGWLNSLPV